jgi:hypothetical protein
VLEQVAADDRTDGDAESGDAGPRRDGAGPLARVGENVDEDRQGRGHDERSTESLQPAQRDQRIRGGHPGTGERSDAEDDETEDEATFAAETIAGVTRDQQEAREHDRVSVDDPLQLTRRRTDVAHERRQRDVHDGAVDPDDEQGQAEHAQDHVPIAMAFDSCRRIGVAPGG